MTQMKDSSTETELKQFLQPAEEPLSDTLRATLLQAAYAATHPSPWSVLLRLALIVLAVGFLNLFLCPQFGIGFVRHSGLFELFMSFGHGVCKLFCGAFFLGSGLFLAGVLLSPDDIRVLRQYRFLHVAALASISLAIFVAAGGGVYFIAAAYWLLGALVGGVLSLEIAGRCAQRVSRLRAAFLPKEV